jgi:hypothetical protein
MLNALLKFTGYPQQGAGSNQALWCIEWDFEPFWICSVLQNYASSIPSFDSALSMCVRLNSCRYHDKNRMFLRRYSRLAFGQYAVRIPPWTLAVTSEVFFSVSISPIQLNVGMVPGLRHNFLPDPLHQCSLYRLDISTKNCSWVEQRICVLVWHFNFPSCKHSK